MSTSATISRLVSKNTATTITVYADGYPNYPGVGNLLLENYNTDAQVRELLEQGNCVSLDCSIALSEFDDEQSEIEKHHVEELADLEEYNYLWTGSEWLVAVNCLWYRLPYYIQADVGLLDHYLTYWTGTEELALSDLAASKQRG